MYVLYSKTFRSRSQSTRIINLSEIKIKRYKTRMIRLNLLIKPVFCSFSLADQHNEWRLFLDFKRELFQVTSAEATNILLIKASDNPTASIRS